MTFERCPVHGEPNAYIWNEEPDDNWEWSATALTVRLAQAEAERAIPTLDLQPAPLRSGLYTLDVDAVSRKGVRLAVDDVFVVVPDSTADPDGPCDCYWEVVGLYKAGGQWVVQPLRVPDTL